MDTVTIRPAYGPYLLSVAILLTAGSAMLRNNLLAAAAMCWAALVVTIFLWAFDRIEFNGKEVRRRGLLAFLLAVFFRSRQRISVSDIESIATEVTSVSLSNGSARLSYQTRISGQGANLVIKAARPNYLPFIKALFQAIGPHKFDPRSLDLYEYFEAGKKMADSPWLRSDLGTMPVPLLRKMANALRLTGNLSQASSFFRIAYEKEPRNPALLYEMSRFFYSSARTEDARLLQRSEACLRLASRLAHKEPDLLERIGEVFFERLDYKRASDCFRRVLELDPARFRANIGLAEIALRDGKLAHAAHFYHAASANSDKALQRMAEREARYYERLMGDEYFLESEMRRLRVANHIRWARRAAALTFLATWLITAVAGRFYHALEAFGWSMMAMCGFVWFATAVGLRYLSHRNA